MFASSLTRKQSWANNTPACFPSHEGERCGTYLGPAARAARQKGAGCRAKRAAQAIQSQAGLILLLSCLRLLVNSMLMCMLNRH